MRLSGSLVSPNYPGPHPQDMDCVWTIKVPEGHQIRLNVIDFQLEKSENCSIDYLEIRWAARITTCFRSIKTCSLITLYKLYMAFNAVPVHSYSSFIFCSPLRT